MEITVFIEADSRFSHELRYVLTIFAQNKGVNFRFVSSPDQADLSFGTTTSYDFIVAENFYSLIGQSQFSFKNHFTSDCLIRTKSGQIDYLSSAFYMLNSLQEYESIDLDEVHRFKYSASYQYQFGNVQENLVQQCFDNLCSHPKLSSLKKASRPSAIFLSHDIDSIHGSLYQDGFYLLKKGKPHLIFKLLLNELLQRPDWYTFDRIMKIEDEYTFKSTFFWLVNQGRLSRREVNADYSITNPRIRSAIQSAATKGWHNGIHKSISKESLTSEIAKSGFTPSANRNHYLKFNLPSHYNEIEKSGLKMDASLGFAEAYGFRNSYSLPFTPFDLKNKKPYSFVEVPLTIMDTTLYRYQKKEVNSVANELIEFLEKNKFNAVISLLWHNNYFTEYKFHGYLPLYKKLLAYFYENNWRSLQPDEIIALYSLN